MSDNLLIRSLTAGICMTNCYVVADPASKEAILVDGDGDPQDIIEMVRDNDLHVIGIVNTHGHADHISANTALKQAFQCPIMIHEQDAAALSDPRLNLAEMIGYSGKLSPDADRILEDGDEIAVGSLTFRVIHTPGHTPGGICLYADGVLISGDTLFARSIGRTDFPRGDHESIIRSIHDKLMVLPGDTEVYPGHGPATSIQSERSSNPWL